MVQNVPSRVKLLNHGKPALRAARGRRSVSADCAGQLAVRCALADFYCVSCLHSAPLRITNVTLIRFLSSLKSRRRPVAPAISSVPCGDTSLRFVGFCAPLFLKMLASVARDEMRDHVVLLASSFSYCTSGEHKSHTEPRIRNLLKHAQHGRVPAAQDLKRHRRHSGWV